MSNSKIVGICGRSGSGKSTVGKMIMEKYPAYIDCDKVARYVTEKGSKCLSELTKSFGNEILNKDGSLNRANLGVLAFGQREKTDLLNRITHKYILEEVERLISLYAEKGEKIIFIDAPTLFESGLDKRCEFIVSVTADKSVLISRIKERDGKTEEEAEKRLLSQYDDAFLSQNSDYIIVNNGTVVELEEKVRLFLEEVKKLYD